MKILKNSMELLLDAKNANNNNDLDWFKNQLFREKVEMHLAYAKALMELHDLLDERH